MNGANLPKYRGHYIEVKRRPIKDGSLRELNRWEAIISNEEGRYRDTVLGHTRIDARAYAEDWIDRQLDGG